MWTNELVLEKLKGLRRICGRKALTQQIINQSVEYGDTVSPELEDMMCRCQSEESRITAWLELLPKEERFIVQTHLVDGLDWTRTIVEYEREWGFANGRSERTLKRIQARALKRITDCLNQLEENTTGEKQ